MTKLYARRFIDPNNLYRRWIDPRVHTLRAAQIAAYLRSRGWTQLPADRPGYFVFQEPPAQGAQAGPYCQFVPDSEEDDLPLRMFEVVTGVAEVEDRQAAEVIDDVLRLAAQADKNGTASERAHPAEKPST